MVNLKEIDLQLCGMNLIESGVFEMVFWVLLWILLKNYSSFHELSQWLKMLNVAYRSQKKFKYNGF